jgi:hypothetical protein
MPHNYRLDLKWLLNMSSTLLFVIWAASYERHKGNIFIITGREGVASLPERPGMEISTKTRVPVLVKIRR